MACVLLYPILSSPVVADDYINPFQQYYSKPGFGGAISYGWNSAVHGVNFRVVGSVIGSLWLWLWLMLSAKLDINMTVLYGATKFAVFILCAVAIAACWKSISDSYGRGIKLFDATALVSAILFTTLQVHGLWSNDPVVSYPLAGYASAALGFTTITCAVLACRHKLWQWYLLGSGVALISVLYYEMNVGAVVAAGVIFLGAMLQERNEIRHLVKLTIGTIIFFSPAIIATTIGRLYSDEQAGLYTGVTMRSSGLPRTFLRGVIGSFPSAAWKKSLDIIDGVDDIKLAALITAVVALASLGWLWNSNIKHADARKRNRFGCYVAVIAIAMYFVFAVFIQAVTVKVQDETPGIGYVYTFYAVTSSVIAMAISVACRSVLLSSSRAALRAVIAVSLLLFMFVQSTVNLNLTRTMNEWVVPNRKLLDAFDKDASENERCSAIAVWAAGDWPDYYETNMVSGLQAAYLGYFGKKFCTKN